jgi:hypothetical protein
MSNYIPTYLSRPVMPADDDIDYNPEIETMIQDKLDATEFENEIWERSEGEGWL